MEEQWLDNILYKGVLQSNTIEANARMCMTSAVTGYIHSLGSDHPPGNYSDIEDADFINHWGHNARGSHPVLFWRVAATKEKRNIPTMVVDRAIPGPWTAMPRSTATTASRSPFAPTAISPFRTPSPTP